MQPHLLFSDDVSDGWKEGNDRNFELNRRNASEGFILMILRLLPKLAPVRNSMFTVARAFAGVNAHYVCRCVMSLG